MAKGQKITKKELENVQATQAKLNNVIFNIGMATIGVLNLVKNQEVVQKEWNDLQEKLSLKYGNVTVNMQDGSIGPAQSEEKE
tara:strand:- start:309 stop:557 length:249 start_codon:yes stop_codon:yes gene_type:complete